MKHAVDGPLLMHTWRWRCLPSAAISVRLGWLRRRRFRRGLWACSLAVWTAWSVVRTTRERCSCTCPPRAIRRETSWRRSRASCSPPTRPGTWARPTARRRRTPNACRSSTRPSRSRPCWGPQRHPAQWNRLARLQQLRDSALHDLLTNMQSPGHCLSTVAFTQRPLYYS